MTDGIDKAQLHILVVEGNREDAELLDQQLEEVPCEFTVSYTDCLAGALQSLELTRFDLVLVDIHLPDCSGIEAFASIIEATANVPIAVLAGKQDHAQALHILRLGAVDYLVKEHLTTPLLTRTIKLAIEHKKFDLLVQASPNCLHWLFPKQ